MKKPASLRAALAAFLPDLARDPDRLAMWVEVGRCRATQSAQRGFAWEYDLTIVVEEYHHDPALLFFILVDWLRTHQPDVLAVNAPGFAFEVDVIDEKASDVKITLPLREVVVATPVNSGPENGGWVLEAQATPASLFPDAEPLREDAGPITSIWLRGDGATVQIVPDPANPAP